MNGGPTEMAAALLRDVAAARPDFIYAYRNKRFWSAHFKAAPDIVAEQPPDPVREGGTYLLTGGLGDLGLAVAEALANQTRVNLVLVGRSGLPPREKWPDIVQSDPAGAQAVRIGRICAMEAKGSKVMAGSADAGDYEAMKCVVDEARRKFGRIHGVFHMAGIAGGSPMVLKDQATMQKVLMPKYFGTLHLQELFRGEKLDFIVLFSSIAALTGGVGQSDYGAANAFMDGVANSGSVACADRVVSINWDFWKDFGMAVTTATELKAEWADIWADDLEKYGISPADGIRALFSIMASDYRQVLVSKRVLPDASRNRAGALNLCKPLPKILKQTQQVKTESTETGRYKRPKLSVEFVAPRTDVEKLLAMHWGEALNIDQVGADDDFFELGGHSLLALQLIPKLRAQYKLDFSARDIFEQAADSLTISRFAAVIEEKVANSKAQQSSIAKELAAS
jgi:NAD(P)-dependent dehydrogenase (short-subunit alcohol dehydrogenase family)/acyl carrier protein